jgi:hypothetical protein
LVLLKLSFAVIVVMGIGKKERWQDTFKREIWFKLNKKANLKNIDEDVFKAIELEETFEEMFT